ncbi:MAG TPA: aminotransferase class I/II-fold pyridoxal phosphate-dependent enzyme [Elusimicrobiota bacterium]|nr:aminotransferase class I/II-fold pyridoxal phosphate-dependent enzyme [Elusimicrobiota bacterium]
MSKKTRPILLDAPNVGALEKEYLSRAIEEGFVSTLGPFVGQFERQFARYCGVKQAVSTQSGTAALFMALYELGVGPGDEVIVPVLTFIASVNPVLQLGAKPVFVDVSPDTWNIDVRQAEKAVTKRTKAILPVHLYGNPCDMRGLMGIARRRGVAVIEDATESLGATDRGRLTGTFGDFGCFSFNGNKIITTGGGGMVVGKDPRRIEHIRFLVNQARDESRGYYHPEVGFNYRMTNIESALGLAQFRRLAGFLKIKRTFHSIYREELGGLSGISLQEVSPGAVSSRWLTCVKISEPGGAARIQKALKKRGIPSRRVFMPLTEFPCYRRFKTQTFGNAGEIYRHALCLPSSTLNTPEQIRRVCREMKNVL